MEMFSLSPVVCETAYYNLVATVKTEAISCPITATDRSTQQHGAEDHPLDQMTGESSTFPPTQPAVVSVPRPLWYCIFDRV